LDNNLENFQRNDFIQILYKIKLGSLKKSKDKEMYTTTYWAISNSDQALLSFSHFEKIKNLALVCL